VQLRVVTDQPWDVPADVLVIPIVGEPAFDGPLGELNRRSGGELAALAAFGELRAKRYTSALATPGENRAGRLVTVSAGPAGDLDRETILHVGAAAQHRLGGRHAASLAVWLSPLATGFDLETVAELVARGVVEGSFDPKTLYRDHDAVATAPPVLDELILVAPDADAASVRKAAERGVIMARAQTTRRPSRTGPRKTSAPRSWPTRPERSPRSTASGSTSSSRTAPASSAWGCSSRSVRAATTRPG